MKIHQLNKAADGKSIPWRGSLGRNLSDDFPLIKDDEWFISIQDMNGDSPQNYSDEYIQLEFSNKSTCIYPETGENKRLEVMCIKAGRRTGDTIQVYGNLIDNIIHVEKMFVVSSGLLRPGSQFANFK